MEEGTTRREELARAATPDAIAASMARRAATPEPAADPHAEHDPQESVREATYRGHRIVVRTSYRIEVDGVPLTGHLAVTNDGRVHYHGLPNYSFASAIDLVKQAIDAFPDDFPPPGEGGHAHPHGHGG